MSTHEHSNGRRLHRDHGAEDCSNHVVHFYAREEFLVDSVAGFVGAGLATGAACIVIATEPHRRQLAERLRADGHDFATARARGTYLALDAAETLARFMADGMPDATRFREVFGGMVAQAAKAALGGEPVRIFGEMVALLWRDGNPAAAVRLEELWNELAAEPAHPFSLFCAYPIQSFAGGAHGEAFGAICACHTRVIPDETYSALTDPDDRLRAITQLQQKAASLEAESAERKAAEERLRISENRYRLLFEASTDGILMIDADSGAVTEANPVMAQLLGLPVEHLLGRELWQIGLFPDRQAAGQFFESVRKQGVVRYETLLQRRHDRGRGYVEVVGSQFRANGHDVIQCHLREITQRKQAEAAAAHLAAIVTSAEDAIVSKSLHGIVTSWNTSAERMFGYTAQEMIGQPITRLFPPDRLDEEDLILARIRAGDRIEHFETVRMTKDGRHLDVSLTISPIKDSAGTIIGASKIVRDITERKRADEALRASEAALRREQERLRFIAETMPQKIFTARANGEVDYFNPQWMHFTGQTFEQIRDWGWTQFVHPDDVEAAVARWRHAIATGEPFYGEHRFRRADGGYRWHISRAIPIRDDDGRITMWIGSATDIDEQKLLEERQNAFISMASHELKTPVTSLIGFTQILKRRLQREGDPQTLRFLDRMDTQLHKLTNLIGDLLDVSKMRAGSLTYRKADFDLDELVRETVENVQAASATHHLRVEGAIGALVYGDRDRVGQVLVNLLTNAIKYSPEADTVVVRLGTDGERAHVAVKDFGIGIAEGDRERIFDRFYQAADLDQNTYPGLGLGLYIARTIVEQHGGRLWVESRRGAGSTFHMSLPLSQAAPADTHLMTLTAEAE